LSYGKALSEVRKVSESVLTHFDRGSKLLLDRLGF
jgi:hypothetical protein